MTNLKTSRLKKGRLYTFFLMFDLLMVVGKIYKKKISKKLKINKLIQLIKYNFHIKIWLTIWIMTGLLNLFQVAGYRSRWLAVHETTKEWVARMTTLVECWNKLDGNVGELSSWVSTKVFILEKVAWCWAGHVQTSSNCLLTVS